MINIKHLVFYSTGHNGDIHYSRNFVKDILSKIPVSAEYRFNSSHKLLKDLKNIRFSQFNLHHQRDNEIIYDEKNYILYINTWVGSSNTKFIQNEVGCSLTANYEKYKQIYEVLNLPYNSSEFYVPDVDWNQYDINQVDKFINENTFNKYVLISNGPVLSGQSQNVNFNELVASLASNNKNIAFLLTDSSSKLYQENIFYTSNFIKTEGGDLNEIGYLGTKCNLIIGRGSGPFCFCHNKDCLFNDKITFLALTNYKTDGLWALPEQLPAKQAKQLWSNTFENSSLYDIINKELN
jgi:hypothetical protein